MTLKRPKGSTLAVAISAVSLFVALGGISVAASFINGHRIKAHTVGHRQLTNNSVWHANLGHGAVQANNLNASLRRQLATHNATGPQGPKGDTGPAGPAGASGSNPATPVVKVPTVDASSGKNPNPDSGDAGDQGWYFTGKGSSGSADLGNGELQLSGVGVDNQTEQGGIGIAKAFSNVPLSALSALSYMWHVNQVNGTQAPTIHITVTGLTNNSKFSNGFSNLTLSPGLNGGVKVEEGVEYMTDGFAANARWYSTTQTAAGDGDMSNPKPLSYFVTNDPNAVITQISLDNGGSSNGTGTWSGGADDLIIGATGLPFTRYDFGG